MTHKEARELMTRVVAFLKSERGQRLVPSDSDGWTLGACNSLASIIVEWLGPATTKWTIMHTWPKRPRVGIRPIPEHVVVEVRAGGRRFWFDGDGVHESRKAMYAAIEEFYQQIYGPIYAPPYSFSLVPWEPAHSYRMGCATSDEARKILKALRYRFGDPVFHPAEIKS